jgi:hypothetical protein
LLKLQHLLLLQLLLKLQHLPLHLQNNTRYISTQSLDWVLLQL